MASLSSRQGGNGALGLLIAASVALHLGVAGVVVGVMYFGRSAPPDPPEAIKTRLVKLGKKRDEKLLPRVEQAPKPKPKKETPKPEKPAETPPPPTKTEKQPAPKPEAQEVKPEKSARDLLDDIAAPTKRDLGDLIGDKIKDEGNEDGSEMGTELVGRLKATYNDKILAQIKKNLNVPKTVSEEERLFLKARVKIAIGGGGELLQNTLVKNSTNAGFDNAVLAAVQKSAPFPAPPVVAQDFYRGGVSVNVCPLSCR